MHEDVMSICPVQPSHLRCDAEALTP